ncbi:SDR family NAD(P)-dependent oxidoreductase [Micromonospora sp. NBC_01796]|uniref:SDR family NAD(P)-dependent oxidoreductase n=1 Tax=Micromonospora sp. NBC_01796 TaxID=2975987 RepID=UPI002DDA6D87|nr:glucose 1-dehydrogenase [Micromonospora sp. NBC_01796]WSA86496.1 glucose 1-dehydrogenase [Micromonospora sp. NBC_01796]
MAGDLAGRTAIVTGGAQGIGEGAVRALHADGAAVVIADVRVAEGEKLAAVLGERVRFVELDVRDPGDWSRVVTQAESAFGRVNVLVNSAGIAPVAPLVEYGAEAFQHALDVNVVGLFHGITAVVPAMRRAGGGSIINVGSIGGFRAYPLMSGYITSKWAVRGLTKATALELGVDGIRVNAVHPGQTDTPMTDGADFDTAHVALKRVGHPADIAGAVLFLAGDNSRFVTGADLVVDGGDLAGSANWDSVPDQSAE